MNNIDFQECSICFEQLLSDVVCCKECEHWIHISCWRTGTCPFCRSVEGWRKLSRIEKFFRNKLTFKCEGCKEKLNILEMSKHVLTCQQVDVECDCGKLIKRGALQIHQRDLCPKRKIQCVFCKGFIPEDGLDNHLQICSFQKNQLCPKRMIQCELCERSLPADRLDDHLKKCPKKMIQCHLCKNSLSRDQLDHHLKKCPKKMIQCSLCKSSLPRDQLEKHFQELCPKVFKCHLCKSKTLFIGQLENHFRECPILHEIPNLLCSYKSDIVQEKFGLTFVHHKISISDSTNHLGFVVYQCKLIFDNNKESYYTFSSNTTWYGDVLSRHFSGLVFNGKVYELSTPKFVIDKIEDTDEYSDVISQKKCHVCHIKINKDEAINISSKIYTHANCWRNLSAEAKKKSLENIKEFPYDFLEFLPPLNLLKNS